MVDPVTITLIVGVATLLVERFFVWASKIKSSDCWGFKMERTNDLSTQKERNTI